MLKNFFDKAKQKVDKLADEINLNSQPKIIKYDESAFLFQVTGGPKHSEPIQAIARVREGDKLGGYLPLILKWFKSDDTDAMKEMPWIKDYMYLPSVDDVGARILVQAVPHLDNCEYTGMPLFSEIGPITLDPEIEKKALANLESDSCSFKIGINQLTPERNDVLLPTFGSIVFNKKERALTLYHNKSPSENILLTRCEYSESYPTIELDHEVIKNFEIHISPEDIFKCTIDDSTQRDILALTIRACAKITFEEVSTNVEQPNNEEAPKQQEEEGLRDSGLKDSESKDSGLRDSGLRDSGNSEPIPEKIELKHQQSLPEIKTAEIKATQQPNLETMMKLESQAKQLKKLQKENDKLQHELEKYQKEIEKKNETENKLKGEIEELNNKKKGEIEELNKTILNFDEEKSKLVGQINSLTSNLDKLNEERAFYVKEINLYKNQVQELDELVQQHKHDENRRRNSLEKLDFGLQFAELERSFKADKAKLQLEIDQLNSDNEKLKKDLETSHAERESLEGQINLLKNKVKVLVKEQEKRPGIEKPSPSIEKNSPSVEKFSPSDKPSPNSSKVESEIQSPTFPKSFSEIQVNKPSLNEKLIVLEQQQSQNDMKLLEEELRMCKEQIKQLNSVITSMKISTAGKNSKQNQTNLDYLQKLVSNLTETIAEKDNFIEQQKTINKHLGERLLQYEDKIKIVSDENN